ncbi:MAG: saccharopine dehydrogenase NADP-binding domain-containing protein [Pseudomonadota bacterium]
MKVLVLGGYGNFGARIARALCNTSGLELLVGGRDAHRVAQFSATVDAKPVLVDATDTGLAQQLRTLGVGIVIHTAGPFQGQNYHVAAACAATGAHYIDLADGRRFVCDFPEQMQTVFAQAGVVGICGASTLPALSSAVIDHLLPRFDRLDAIDICIAPAQRAPRGVATLAGVLSYCGRPVHVWRGGRWASETGWANPQPVAFARMPERLAALCDVPDLELLPARYTGVSDVVFRAALELRSTQHAFALLAWATARGWLRQPQKLAPLLHRAAGVLDGFGSELGGMVVRLRGSGAQQLRTLAWHITAGNNHGPEIPCMAAVLLARKLVCGDGPPPGAYACMGLLALDEFNAEFARWGMVCDVVDESAAP